MWAHCFLMDWPGRASPQAKVQQQSPAVRTVLPCPARVWPGQVSYCYLPRARLEHCQVHWNRARWSAGQCAVLCWGQPWLGRGPRPSLCGHISPTLIFVSPRHCFTLFFLCLGFTSCLRCPHTCVFAKGFIQFQVSLTAHGLFFPFLI